MTPERRPSTPDPRWTDRALGEAEVREAALASAHLLR